MRGSAESVAGAVAVVVWTNVHVSGLGGHFQHGSGEIFEAKRFLCGRFPLMTHATAT